SSLGGTQLRQILTGGVLLFEIIDQLCLYRGVLGLQSRKVERVFGILLHLFGVLYLLLPVIDFVWIFRFLQLPYFTGNLGSLIGPAPDEIDIFFGFRSLQAVMGGRNIVGIQTEKSSTCFQ